MVELINMIVSLFIVGSKLATAIIYLATNLALEDGVLAFCRSAQALAGIAHSSFLEIE